jgi:glycerol-3-phosphate acyltransferase PlsX
VPDLRHLRRPPGHRGLSQIRIAVDLLGGDHAPDAVVAGAVLAAQRDPRVVPALVGPPEVIAAAFRRIGAADDAVPVVPATQVVEMDEDPARAVRAKRDATVRVAARLVRDGAADAFVSVGSTGAAMAAAVFTLGRLPGVTRPALAVAVPAPGGTTVLLDVGATTEAGPDLLVQFALAGAAYGSVLLGLSEPRVALLSNGSEPGKGDPVRQRAHALLAGLDVAVGGPLRFIGNVEGGDLTAGGTADVIVTDGFTGNVVLKAVEGAVTAVRRRLAEAGELPAAFAALTKDWGVEGQGGGVLLGVDGVVVVGHGSSSPAGVAAAIATAARAVDDGLLCRLRTALADLVSRRRVAAGLPPGVTVAP